MTLTIDTDEYERILKDDDGRNNVFALDLLAEVKRLRERNDWLCWAIADITKGMDEDWRTWQKALKELIE